MKDYDYTVQDNSALTLAFKRVFVQPLMHLIPKSLPANFITLICHLLVYLALYLSYRDDVSSRGSAILISFLIFLHLLGDKLDGAHATRTKTSSGLGELIDHVFDLFNLGAILFIIFYMYDINHGWIILAALAMIVLVVMTRYYQQYKTGILKTEKLGALELTLCAVVIIFLAEFAALRNMFSSPVLMGYSLIELVLVIFTLTAGILWMRMVVQMKQITFGFWLFVALLLVVTASCLKAFDPVYAGILILLYGGLYTGRLLVTQLVDGIERSPGFFTPIFLLIHVLAGYFDAYNTFLILSLYLVVNILLILIRAFYALKQDWLWVNPKEK